MKKTVNRMKIGDKIKMYFRCFGVESVELVKIKRIDRKNSILIIEDTWHSDDSGKEENGKFNMKNGRCLNDNAGFGGSRRIDPI
jgi:hypothetical protein